METETEEVPIEIERMREYDYDDATKLMLDLCQFIGVKFDEERWSNAFSKRIQEPKKYAGFIARKKDKPVGMVFVEMRGKYGIITNLYIVPEERYTEPVGPLRLPRTEKHLGQMLLNEAIEFIRESGGKEALINLKRGVKPAEKLYQRMGFKEKYIVLSKAI
ncbi:MAG: GNAT family N-acetyltransferase [Candidatus Freyarchaeota archaeon]